MMPITKKDYTKLYSALFFTILFIGLALRFYQYFMSRSLWEDEAHLALNFMNRGFAGLMKPLDNIQAAPPLFLISVKVFNELFGYGPKALRALPFIGSVLTLPLFYYIIKDLTRNRVVALIGFLIFSVNLSLIYFSSELKTYGIDVVMMLVMVWLTFSANQWINARRNILLALAGCVFILYSNVTFIILFCIGCHMLMTWIREKKVKPAQIKVLLCWALFFAVYYFTFLFHHPYQATQASLYSFAFPPGNVSSPAFFAFIQDRTREIAFTLLLYVSDAYGFAYVLIFIFCVAIFTCIKNKRYDILLFTLVPLILHFLLSFFKIYPFWYRFLIYLLPGLMLLMAIGTYEIAVFIGKKTHVLAGLLVTVIMCSFFTAPSLKNFPLWFREIGPALRNINTYPANTKLYITTPYTLYKYSLQNHSVNDTNYEALQWPITPKQYFETVGASQNDYLLLHATDTGTDGYGAVLRALQEKGLIIREFNYKTYTVSLIKSLNRDKIMLNYNSFSKDRIFDLNGKKVTALWDSAPQTAQEIMLSKGYYEITIVSNGTPAKKVYPHINVFMNDEKAHSYFTSSDYSEETFSLEQKNDGKANIKLAMDNDLSVPEQNEDRNAFILYIQIKRVQHP